MMDQENDKFLDISVTQRGNFGDLTPVSGTRSSGDDGVVSIDAERSSPQLFVAQEPAQEETHSLLFTCPVDDLKFAFHRQDQVEMIERHTATHAAELSALRKNARDYQELLAENERLRDALKEIRVKIESAYENPCNCWLPLEDAQTILASVLPAVRELEGK